MRKKKIAFNEFFDEENTKVIFKETKVNDLDDLYLNIGNNKFSPSYIISIIYKKESISESKVKLSQKNNDNDIIVDGIDKIKVNLANCCNPLPGDEIVGYITKGNGISVHRINCLNLEYLDNRMISVKWNDNIKNKYLTSIIVYAQASDDFVFEITQKASSFNISIDNIKTLKNADTFIYEIDLWVRDVEHLNNFIRNINTLKYVVDVMRIMK